MAKKRARISDAGLFQATEPTPASQPKQKKVNRPDRVLKRATYDMTPEIKTAVSQRATRLGIPASQLAMFLLCDALQRYDAGDIDPTPYLEESDSPKFRNTLRTDEWYHLD